MRIALIGAAGQLGTDLLKCLPHAHPLTHAEIEITDSQNVAAVLDPLAPDIVVNTAAYNLVDKAEDEPERAFAINAQGPETLARWCNEHNATLVHVSTDYVFGADAGRTLPYTEADESGPLGVYGRSKLAGEMAVQGGCPRHFVIRTCGLYGQAATKSKGNFVKTMLRLADERSELKVVSDQHCTPSYTADVAAMIAAILKTTEYGLYHVTNSGAATWHAVAAEVLRLAGKSTPVIPIPSSEYPTKARRPGYSVLDCRKAEQLTGLTMPDWEDALGRYLAEIH
ncbi:dTDP-4-dehydrorhamnose reductase [Planctomicrobium piriforme]|uniref:dTDP-4-dehydrorhamnose reductase n=1 Tax=Planctomicrobium piriforme TaxID=1576369 RepID=A0A1I3H0G3_9PLAN|nr:dTDP-4-dehydrorhamnose reductase [Planctomicrobium piriforme]SFI29151.1 dTDP-4-dehydrorhamnose reductase [Planctomicrobium piriforme]